MGRMIALLMALTLCGAAQTGAEAQTPYPARPVRIVVPFGPGGFADIVMRIFGQRFADIAGQQVVIENRPSAGGVVAANAVTSAQADGYTLFVLSSGIALSRALLKNMPFDPVTAFTPISTVAYFDLLVLAKGDGPLRDIKDVLAAARANPQSFNVGTISPGSTQNMTAELLRSAAGIPMTIVPYRNTGEVLTALLRNDVQIAVESYAALKAAIDDGQIRAVAASGDKRSPMQPDVPTLRESGIEAEVTGWNALVAPAGTPPDIVATLNRHINTIVGSPDYQKRVLDLGGEAKASTSSELGARLLADVEKWKDVAKKAGIEPR